MTRQPEYKITRPQADACTLQNRRYNSCERYFKTLRSLAKCKWKTKQKIVVQYAVSCSNILKAFHFLGSILPTNIHSCSFLLKNDPQGFSRCKGERYDQNHSILKVSSMQGQAGPSNSTAPKGKLSVNTARVAYLAAST
jgi:hypothetical protein